MWNYLQAIYVGHSSSIEIINDEAEDLIIGVVYFFNEGSGDINQMMYIPR